MKIMHNAAVAVAVLLFGSTLMARTDSCTSAATRDLNVELQPNSTPNGNVASRTVANGQKHDLVITRVFDAPIEQVWKAWTDPAFVMRWWGPTGFTSPSCKID